MGAFLAFDFGASSGRAIVGKIESDKIQMTEIHRFANDPVFLGERYVWDFPKLLNDMKTALKKASQLEEPIESIGIDTWGVDFGLLDKDNNLIGMPLHYRDNRNQMGMERANEIIHLKEIYMESGIANLSFNTSFQLVADSTVRKDILKNTDTLLFMPDLFAYFLTGEKRNEFTIASTSGLIDMRKGQWNNDLMEKLSIPKNIFAPIIEPGQVYGYLTDDVMEETGLGKIPVVAIGGHDTASAVAGAPIENDKYAFLSSGTWSLLGLEVKSPKINETTYKYNFTNEGGVDNTIRLLKNINGLWLIQQLKKNWCEFKGEIDFPDIIEAARKCEDSKFVVDTNQQEFMNTKNMIKTIQQYCVKNGQGIPESLGELAMAIYNGLTLEYKNTIEELEEIVGHDVEGINIVGGGIKDSLLCELTAKRTGKTIIAGPIEAAVLGNIMVQAMALGKVNSIENGRKLIKKSFDYKVY